MQHRRTKENVFFRRLSLHGNGSHSRCLSGSQPRRSWLSMQRKGKGVILLFATGVFLASILPAAAEDSEEEGSWSNTVTNVGLQPRHQGNTSRASSSENKHETRVSTRELSEKEKLELKRTDRDKKKANKPVQIGNKGERESGATDNPPTRCAQNLRDAINGAISLIAGTRLLVEHLLRLWSSVPYVPMLVCPSSLFPYNPTLPWPKREMLKKGDLLRDVLESGTLNVAGVGGASLSSGQVQFTVARDRGEEGNYNRAEPTGFFPDYLRAIADTIEKQYKTPIRVRWLFYPTVESAQAGVLRGEAHMTDIYFLLAHSTPGEPQPLAHFYSTCPVVGSPVLLIVRESLSHGESEVNDLLSLNRIIDRAKTDSDRQLVFVSPELATTVRHCLSPFALITFAEDLDQAAQLVLDGNAVAVVATGVLPRLHPLLRVVSAHILLGKGAWIERTYAVECVEDEHGFDLAAYARERSPRESKRVFEAGGKARENNTLAGSQPSATQHALWISLLSWYVVL